MSDDARAAKILADLLALTLSEIEPQAEAAIGAIRRRAAHDEVTGGAVKALASRLLSEHVAEGELALREDAPDIVQMRWTIDDQARELHELRHAHHLAEASLTDIHAANTALAERIGGLVRGRRTGWVLGFLLGAACIGGMLAVFYGTREVRQVEARPVAAKVAHTRLTDALHSCFLASSNSLGGGTPFDLHLLLDVDAQGHITGQQVAPDQSGEAASGDTSTYAQMVLRTLGSGSCGALPMPASLQGKAGRLDLILPR